MNKWQISVREISNGFLVEFNDWSGDSAVDQETKFVKTVEAIPEAVLSYLTD